MVHEMVCIRVCKFSFFVSFSFLLMNPLDRLAQIINNIMFNFSQTLTHTQTHRKTSTLLRIHSSSSPYFNVVFVFFYTNTVSIFPFSLYKPRHLNNIGTLSVFVSLFGIFISKLSNQAKRGNRNSSLVLVYFVCFCSFVREPYSIK